MKKIFDWTTVKFLIVGVINTLVGTSVMFIAYNVFHFNYWVSSAANYVVGSIVSYFLNRNFTFKSQDRSLKSVLRFILNISICYLLAYGIARPLARWIFSGLTATWQDNLAMLAGMCIFVVLNYCGQRFFVFKT